MLLFITSRAYAQDDVKGSIEGGLHGGFSQFYGDVSSGLFNWKQKGLVLGLHGRYNISSKFTAKLSFTYGRIKGDDALSKSSYQQHRNINFRTSIKEFSLVCEYNIMGFSSGSKRKYPGMEFMRFSPYVFTGIDLYFFTPKSEVGGKYYKVKTLDTELGKRYSMFNFSIPFGAGVKYSPINLWTLGFEVGMRKTFTDELDDVAGYYADYNMVGDDQGQVAALLSDPSRLIGSNTQKTGPRGNPRSKDWYLFINLSITKKLYFKNY